MSLDFLPRKLQRRATKQAPKVAVQDDSISHFQPKEIGQNVKGKRKAAPEPISDEIILASFKLAFSDYTLNENNVFRDFLWRFEDEDCTRRVSRPKDENLT